MVMWGEPVADSSLIPGVGSVVGTSVGAGVGSFVGAEVDGGLVVPSFVSHGVLGKQDCPCGHSALDPVGHGMVQLVDASRKLVPQK